MLESIRKSSSQYGRASTGSRSIKSSYQYGMVLTGSRSCGSGNLSSGCMDASGSRWHLQCITAEVPVTRGRTADCSRERDRECRDAEKCQSESLASVYSRRGDGRIANHLTTASPYGMGSHSGEMTGLRRGVGVYPDTNRTQLAKWHKSLRDSQYGHLDEL